ncbi:MAG: permease [Ignavibacteriaceae bacterium]|nr:permease [Ignavibacteriaceae bacterium]
MQNTLVKAEKKGIIHILFLPAMLLAFWLFIYLNIEKWANYFTISVIKLNENTRFADTLRFFLFEVPKVLLLLVLIVFIVGIIRSYFSPEKTRKILEGKPLFAGNIMASLLGTVTPFCSCSAIPLFLGFIESGVPLGVTFSFLIAAPMINEIAVVLLFGLFGWKTALIYMTTGLLIAMISGFIIGKLRLEKYVEDWVYKIKSSPTELQEQEISFKTRIQSGYNAVKEIVGKIWIYIIIGIAVGAGVHGYVPENFMAGMMGKSTWWSVPLSVLIGVPLYSNAAGIIPIVQALLEKGASLGTVLAFMMSVIGLSLPETIILKKVLKLPLIFTFVGIVAAGIMLVGYLFNIIY